MRATNIMQLWICTVLKMLYTKSCLICKFESVPHKCLSLSLWRRKSAVRRTIHAALHLLKMNSIYCSTMALSFIRAEKNLLSLHTTYTKSTPLLLSFDYVGDSPKHHTFGDMWPSKMIRQHSDKIFNITLRVLLQHCAIVQCATWRCYWNINLFPSASILQHPGKPGDNSSWYLIPWIMINLPLIHNHSAWSVG